MKVFVGTMECGENDFDNCSKIIKEQENAHICHFVVSNMSEHEAHQKLYSVWEQAKNTYELFIKVDADTILSHSNVISEHVKLFTNNPRLTGTQAWLHDYLTDSKIYGLSCIRNTVSFTKCTNHLYPDRVDGKHDIVLRGDQLPNSLNPAGVHCPNPSDKQAFHYGVHRALKNQTQIISKVYNCWKQYGDKKRALVLIGAKYSAKFVNNLEFNYTDEKFNKAFIEVMETYENLVKCL